MKPELKPLRKLLSSRGASFKSLASAAKVSSSHLSVILSGAEAGKQIWPKLKILLSEEEQALCMELYGPLIFHTTQEKKRAIAEGVRLGAEQKEEAHGA